MANNVFHKNNNLSNSTNKGKKRFKLHKEFNLTLLLEIDTIHTCKK